jgi:hypothetical protein
MKIFDSAHHVCVRASLSALALGVASFSSSIYFPSGQIPEQERTEEGRRVCGSRGTWLWNPRGVQASRCCNGRLFLVVEGTEKCRFLALQRRRRTCWPSSANEKFTSFLHKMLTHITRRKFSRQVYKLTDCQRPHVLGIAALLSRRFVECSHHALPVDAHTDSLLPDELLRLANPLTDGRFGAACPTLPKNMLVGECSCLGWTLIASSHVHAAWGTTRSAT